MNPRYKPLIAGAALVFAGVALVVGLRLGARQAAPAPVAEVMHTDQKANPPTPVEMQPSRQQTPPWMQGATATNPVTRSITSTLQDKKSLSAEEAQQVVGQVRIQATQNIAKIDQLLAQIDQLAANPNKNSTVNISVVRDNILVARRAQMIALEMAEATQQPESPKKDARLKQLVAELQSIQGKIRLDINSAQGVKSP